VCSKKAQVKKKKKGSLYTHTHIPPKKFPPLVALPSRPSSVVILGERRHGRSCCSSRVRPSRAVITHRRLFGNPFAQCCCAKHFLNRHFDGQWTRVCCGSMCVLCTNGCVSSLGKFSVWSYRVVQSCRWETGNGEGGLGGKMATIGLSKVFILDKYFTELQKFWETERKVQGITSFRYPLLSPPFYFLNIVDVISFFAHISLESLCYSFKSNEKQKLGFMYI
jgi:hypothetical protein